MIPRQGDILLVWFPFANLSSSKLRPVLVLSSIKVNKGEDVVCVQITSKKFQNLFFVLDAGAVSPPLPLESGIRLHKIFTIEKSLIHQKIGSLEDKVLSEVLFAINNKVFS